MRITGVRIRRSVAPVTAAVSVKLGDASSPLVQVYDGEYEPDRTVTPLVLVPEITVDADDGSLDEPYTQADLSTDSSKTYWTVNGVKVSDAADWKDYCTTDTSVGASRGTLTVRKNLPSGAAYELVFHGVINDARTGTNIHLVSDPVTLYTTDKTEDEYILTTLGEVWQYNPVTDPLLLAEYRAAHGEEVTAGELAEAAADARAYLHTWPLTLRKGTAAVKGFDVTLYLDGSASALTDMTGTAVTSYGTGGVTVDARLCERATILAVASVDGVEAGRVTLTEKRITPECVAEYANRADAASGDDMRTDTLLVRSYGMMLDYPELPFAISWYADTPSGVTVSLAYGSKTVEYSLTSCGLVDGTQELVEWADVSPKPVYASATDAGGSLLTDADGTEYIFN